MKLIWGSLVLAAVTSVAMVGCGGGGGGGGNSDGICTKAFDACGGEVAGDWKVTGVCFKTLPDCTENYRYTKLPTMTYSFGASGTVQVTTTGSATVSATIDYACEDDEATSCADLEESDDDGNVSCTAKGGTDCACTATVPTSFSASGTYSTSGEALTLGLGDSGQSYTYCRSGSTLTLANDDAILTLKPL